MKKDLKRLSKFLAVVLRHNPENFNIALDERGFAPLNDVWAVIKHKYGDTYSRDDLESIVHNGDDNAKKRYEIMDNHIRAMYGHSKPTIVYPSIEPPIKLFHGTNAKALINIRKNGLSAQQRQYVHMTTSYDTAVLVASRRTNEPIILTIHAKEAYKNGLIFHNPEGELYLSKGIPVDYIDFSSH